MRVAFCGKGGSGKTSLAALIIQFLKSQNKAVLAIDGDINQHLGTALGFSDSSISSLYKLGQKQNILQDYVRGSNSRIQSSDHIIESTPAGRGSRFISQTDDNIITRDFMLHDQSLRFMAVGGHEDHDVGTTCFHKFTGAEGIFLNHYLDEQDEYVIADMCAGADPFASSGLATRFDACVIVLEPSLKSLAVYHQAKEYTQPYNTTLIPVANKCLNSDDVKFIEDQIQQSCAAVFGMIPAVRDAEKGLKFDIQQLDANTRTSLQNLKNIFDSLPPRDWKKYQEIGKSFHQRAADGWASAMFGVDLMQQFDSDFSYPEQKPSINQKAA